MPEPLTRPPPMTADAFLAFDGEGDTRYELHDGVPVAMAPASVAHGTISGNAWGEITRHLLGRPPCRAVIEAGIRLDEYSHFVADLAVTCSEPAGEAYVEAPALIVEVLSPANHKDAIALKLRRYIELPSVSEIWLVDSRERWVQIWRRTGAGWLVTLPLRGDAGFDSRFLDAEIGLDALYRLSGI